jgi:hypothetical protein
MEGTDELKGCQGVLQPRCIYTVKALTDTFLYSCSLIPSLHPMSRLPNEQSCGRIFLDVSPGSR